LYRKSLKRASNSGFEVGWKDGRALLRTIRVDVNERDNGRALAMSVARRRRRAQRVHNDAIANNLGQKLQVDTPREMRPSS
jgi:hypothetical protein